MITTGILDYDMVQESIDVEDTGKRRRKEDKQQRRAGDIAKSGT